MKFPKSAKIKSVTFAIDEKDYSELDEFSVENMINNQIDFEGNKNKITEIDHGHEYTCSDTPFYKRKRKFREMTMRLVASDSHELLG